MLGKIVLQQSRPSNTASLIYVQMVKNSVNPNWSCEKNFTKQPFCINLYNLIHMEMYVFFYMIFRGKKVRMAAMSVRNLQSSIIWFQSLFQQDTLTAALPHKSSVSDSCRTTCKHAPKHLPPSTCRFPFACIDENFFEHLHRHSHVCCHIPILTVHYNSLLIVFHCAIVVSVSH